MTPDEAIKKAGQGELLPVWLIVGEERMLRDQVVVYEGKIGSLRRFKDDAREVQQGYECGIGVENFNDIKVGDILEAFVMEEEAGKF